jgi:N-acetylmuramoyl-L-alanine amidase
MKPPFFQTNDAPKETTTPRRKNPAQVNAWLMLQTAICVAIVTASLFTIWTPASLFNSQLTDRVSQAIRNNGTSSASWPTATPLPSPHIGIISGHWGADTGAVCSDGLTEADVNLNIATIVKQNLISEGYTVDFFQEKDSRINQFQGLVLVAIHNDSCEYVNDSATGFKLYSALGGSSNSDRATRLTSCMADRYQKVTGLTYHSGGATDEMKNYHAFSEINPNTPATMIEAGYMNLDRDILTKHPDAIARGITDGIVCFIRNESLSVTPTPIPTNIPAPTATLMPTPTEIIPTEEP